MKKTVHLICNAHLDPVWLWEWQEGAAEAISTFRVAADLCEKYPDFIFNHNEVTLYKWVQEYEPALFKRIQKLVRAGRWHIMGGWYLQPDCNMPSGESFVRQILLGKNYFKANFDVEPTTAINFDSFGHTRGLVQILKKSGYDSYLFGRPMPEIFKLPQEDFVWVGLDGSEIIARRFLGWYQTNLGKAHTQVQERIAQSAQENCSAILWGVGNHGGGPSKKDVADLERLIRQHKDIDIRHSTPENYFKEIAKRRPPQDRFAKGLNPFAIGCYTSQIRVKQKHRLLENEYYMTEKMIAAASVAGLMKYPADDLRAALCDLMVGEFHDILPGSSIQPVEEAALRMYDHGLEILSRLKARAFFALASGQQKAKPCEIPVLVYNPHPFAIDENLECEFNLADFNTARTFFDVRAFQDGAAVPAQVERELSNLPVDWRKRLVFQARLRPGMNRFDCRVREFPKKPAPALKAKNGRIVFKTDSLRVVINTRTGLIDSLKTDGVECIRPGAFLPIVMKDNIDSWENTAIRFSKVIGKFKLMSRRQGSKFSGMASVLDSVRVVEDGPVRSVIEAVFGFDDSRIAQHYILPKSGAEFQVCTRVFWNQKDQMLKLAVSLVSDFTDYIGQVAYGVDSLPNNGNEAVAQKWTAAVSSNKKRIFTCINDGTYGSDFSPAGLRLTLLRAPLYSGCPDHTNIVNKAADRFTPRQDQGERLFRFWFNAGKFRQLRKTIDRRALTVNEKPFALSFFPSGAGSPTKPFALLSDDSAQITAIKRAEKGGDFIVRLFEPTGKICKTTLHLPTIKKKITLTLNPFEIKTLKINPKTGSYAETSLLER